MRSDKLDRSAAQLIAAGCCAMGTHRFALRAPLIRPMEPTAILSPGPKLKANFTPAPASLAAHPAAMERSFTRIKNNRQRKGQMEFEDQLRNSGMKWGADYFGIADLSAAQDAILEQGGTEIAEYTRSISIGISLFQPIVDQLPRRQERSVAASYRSHCYDIINARLDQIISRLASVLQREGHKVYPVAASRRVDDDRICAIFSHKLSAHLAGLGWIGKNCLLITPDRGPRVRWATLLTDAPLETRARPMDERCGDCRDCIDICPVRAFTGEPFRTDESRDVRFDAGKCDRYFSKMKEKDDETAVCGLCLYICRHGRQQRRSD